MLVTFISQCEKKGLARTRRVLDAFADRIGSNTWQTVITEDGLIAVKNLLRKTATKNTAVACHWARSRSRSDLVWIVGNRNKFSREGIVPVNTTQQNILSSDWENNWTYLPLIKSLVAVSALLHDWGKATLTFQKKLAPSALKNANANVGDPLRHEWISCLLLHAVVQATKVAQNQAAHNQHEPADHAWLNLLISGQLNEKELTLKLNPNTNPLADLPPIAQLVAWLILTHHRLPSIKEHNDRLNFSQTACVSIEELFNRISSAWGYQNKNTQPDYPQRLAECFVFPHGLLSQSDVWLKQLQKWTGRLKVEVPIAITLLTNGGWRLVLHHARLSLMLGDHYYSSLPADQKWNSNIALYANTDSDRHLKQKLDEHLVRVSENALRISQTLSRFSQEMDYATDTIALKKKSPKGFEWQDIAVDALTRFKQHKLTEAQQTCGYFIVNMASTGCGKTIANAKIMRALSKDANSLRYILALGLRSLTLQTGDEYRNKIGLSSDELAVLIGSASVLKLHRQAQTEQNLDSEPTHEELGSESLDELLDGVLADSDAPTADFLEAVIPANASQQKRRAFLYRPVLTCTIDHMMAATETTRGGRYILPCLRLLSSDLVIDEVDDFDGQDLIAIGRLIHLAGMLGRKVMISSATIPPALAEGFFHSYYEGWRIHAVFHHINQGVTCAWVDEFKTQVNFIHHSASHENSIYTTAKPLASKPLHCLDYQQHHHHFIAERVQKLQQQLVKRKGKVVDLSMIFDAKNRRALTSSQQQSKIEQYYTAIQTSIIELHQHHHVVDPVTQRNVSFGVVRVANIPQCVELAQYLMKAEWAENIDVKVMAYHSRQLLLLRHEQEKHLDQVLKRNKEHATETPPTFNNPIIREHLNQSQAKQVIFILVATPVEEVGRDHDFDWAVIEPSSYRSIIQLAGRVKRHRNTPVNTANIAVMQYNLKAMRLKNTGKTAAAYCRPGYETHSTLRLDTHDMYQLINTEALQQSVNAIPRIQPVATLQPKKQLADLEHVAIANYLTQYQQKGPAGLSAWIHETWWMTALPQQLNGFRSSSPEVTLYYYWQEDHAVFHEKNEKGRPIKVENMYGISQYNMNDPISESRLWLTRHYQQALERQGLLTNSYLQGSELTAAMQKLSLQYGELSYPVYKDKSGNIDLKTYWYSDQFGLWPKTK